MLKPIALAGLLILATLAATMAQSPAVQADHVWARATPTGAKTAALYMTLVNKGATDDRLVSAATAIAGKADLHTTIADNGVMRMRPVAAIDVKPGTPAVLKPGGYHIMLMNLKGPLVEGQSFTVSLTFEKAGKIEVTAVVEKAGAMNSGTMPGMKM